MNISPGDLIEDRFRVEARLPARNGVVYEAFDTGADRRVVFKFLAPEVLDVPAARARFERELEIVANLRDPHAVRVFGHGEHEDRPYIIFEYVPGEDLSALIERGPWPAAIAQRVLSQLLAVLAEAHRAGVIHRAVCPENIRVFDYFSDTWNVKLLDFGLGRPTDQSGQYITLTETGEVLGVPRYMPPEAIRGESLTAASDVYSLGIIALELILGPDALGTGPHPPNPEALQHAIDRVEPSFGPVLRRMLVPDPERRFASAESVATALGRLGDAPREPPSTLPQFPKPQQPGPWLLALPVAAVGLLVAVVLWPGEKADRVLHPAARGPGSLVKSKPKPDPSQRETAAPPTKVATPGQLAGCGRDAPFTGTSTLTLMTGPVSADTWMTTIPDQYHPTKPHPLVVLLHGAGQSADDLLKRGGFEKLAHENRFIVVAPEAKRGLIPWRQDSDGERLGAIVGALKERLCIDEDRVFAVGHSQGGHVIEKNMCAPWIKAIAFHSYRGPATPSRCPDRERPLIFISPTESPHIPFDGGLGCANPMTGEQKHKESMVSVEEALRDRNSCRGESTVATPAPSGRCYTWDCEVPFESCHIEGGHRWPGVEALDHCAGPEPADFPVAERIWRFLSAL